MSVRLSTRRVLLASAAVAVLNIALVSQTPAASVYTAAQADAGRMLYRGYCESCHQPDMAGANDAPPLAGPNFMTAWRTHRVSELVNRALTMPPDGGGISDDQYLELVAFILQRNGAVAGDQPLRAGTSAVIGEIATGVAAPAAAQPGTGGARQGAAASGRRSRRTRV
jgi:mono/diheme cytochrome c family protein